MDGKAKRILFYSEGWGRGGIESFVMNAMRVLDPGQYQCDVFCTHDWDTGYDKEITSRGGTRTAVFKGYKPGLATRLRASSSAWRRVLASGDYDIVHINTMNGVGFVYSAIARQQGVPLRIVHSHNTRFGDGMQLAKSAAHRAGKTIWGRSANVRLACSSAAGHYLFGNDDFLVMPNAIDVDAFRFLLRKREGLRGRFGIPEDALVVGFVGRMIAEKNPIFAIDVFSYVKEAIPNAVLLMVGSGPLDNEVDSYIKTAGLSEDIRRVPSSDDMPGLYCAMDVLCSPSAFEGFLLVAIEAQATGLPVLYADTVPPDAALTNLVHTASLAAPKKEWAGKIIELARIGAEGSRESYARCVADRGFSLDVLKTTLETVYE